VPIKLISNVRKNILRNWSRTLLISKWKSRSLKTEESATLPKSLFLKRGKIFLLTESKNWTKIYKLKWDPSALLPILRHRK